MWVNRENESARQVKDALDLLDRHHDPLQTTRVSRVSFAGLMVLTAQDIREEGLPDWMQVRRYHIVDSLVNIITVP